MIKHEDKDAKFKLTIHAEDEQELRTYVQAPQVYSALYELSERLRDLAKYGFDKEIKTPRDGVDNIRMYFYQILELHGINLDDY